MGYSGSDAGALVGPLQIPAIVYLIRTSDRVLFDLQHLVPSTGRMMMQKDGSFLPDPYGEYQDIYQSFYKAKRIATYPREVAFVHEHFCDRLMSLYPRLTEDQKSALAKYDTPGFSYADKYYRGGSYAGHASEVVPSAPARIRLRRRRNSPTLARMAARSAATFSRSRRWPPTNRFP